MEFFHSAYHYVRHWLLEINDHSLHSPYLFEFYSQVIRNSKRIPSDPEIEALREQYMQDHSRIPVDEWGSGSRIHGRRSRRLSDIARSGITSARYSKLLMSIIHYYGFRTVIELGTSLGLNTLYLSKGKTVELLLTFEGNPILAELAAKHFKYHTPKEIRMIQGDIDHTLTDQLKQIGKVDFVYLDANHTAEATWRYFNLLRSCLSGRSVLVFDDIYWSSGMTQAWKKISQLPHKKLCLDLYQVGILIYDEKAPEGYFRLAF